MATPNHNLGRVVKQIRMLAGAAGVEADSDRDLLRRYVAAGDEAAFACLVDRHASMVLGVCRKMVRHHQDAEDAFQATFLVLARKARTIRQQQSVGGWLYSVAYRIANKLRVSQARRRARENPLTADAPGRASEELSWREVQQVLYAELDRLADKYRAPLLLCYVQGKTRDEAAQQLDCELSVLRGRLERGRDILRARLVRRGLSLAATLLAVGMAETGSAAGAVPAALLSSSIQAALGAAKSTAVAAGVSAQVAALTQGVLRAMFLSKLKSVALGLMGLAVVGTGIGLVSFETSAQETRATPAVGAQKQGQSAKQTNDDLDPRKLKEENERLRRELELVRAELLAALRENVRLREVAQSERDAARRQEELTRREWTKALEGEAMARRSFLTKPNSPEASPATLAITSDGKVLALAKEKGVHLIDIATGKQLALLANNGMVRALAWSPDGKVLASGSNDKTVRLWETQTGKEIRRIDVPGAATEIRFRPDGKNLIVIEMNGAQLEIDVNAGIIRSYAPVEKIQSR